MKRESEITTFIHLPQYHITMQGNISKGDTVVFQPKNGGTFPTGEKTRNATVEAVREDELIIRQSDGFTDRITKDQLLR
jgi:hypothetical protein